MASRPHRSRTRQLRRRRRRQVLVGLTSLALVVTGTSSIATPEQPEAAEVLEEVAQPEPTLDVEVAPEDAATVAPDAPEAEQQDSPPAQEESSQQAEEDPDTEVTEEAADTESEEPAGEVTDAPAQEPDEAAAADVGILQVPPGEPGEDEAKLIVRAGGDRTGTGPTSSQATPLAGVTFEFFRVTADTPPGVLVDRCTTDETGACGVFVDLPGEFAGSDAFYARQTEAPEGWTAPQQWSAGGQYVFVTDPVSATDSTAARITELPRPFPRTATEPTWGGVRGLRRLLRAADGCTGGLDGPAAVVGRGTVRVRHRPGQRHGQHRRADHRAAARLQQHRDRADVGERAPEQRRAPAVRAGHGARRRPVQLDHPGGPPRRLQGGGERVHRRTHRNALAGGAVQLRQRGSRPGADERRPPAHERGDPGGSRAAPGPDQRLRPDTQRWRRHQLGPRLPPGGRVG